MPPASHLQGGGCWDATKEHHRPEWVAWFSWKSMWETWRWLHQVSGALCLSVSGSVLGFVLVAKGTWDAPLPRPSKPLSTSALCLFVCLCANLSHKGSAGAWSHSRHWALPCRNHFKVVSRVLYFHMLVPHSCRICDMRWGQEEVRSGKG